MAVACSLKRVWKYAQGRGQDQTPNQSELLLPQPRLLKTTETPTILPVDSRIKYILWAGGNQINHSQEQDSRFFWKNCFSDYFDLPDSVLTAESIIIFNPNLDLLWDDSHIVCNLSCSLKKKIETRLLLGFWF